MSMTPETTIMIVGGPDVNARIDLIQALGGQTNYVVAGSNADLETQFRDANITYYNYRLGGGLNPVSYLISVLDLYRLFRRIRPQLVHTFDTKPSMLGRLAAFFARVPVIVGTLPGLGSLYVATSSKAKVFRTGYELVQRVICRASDLTIFQNHDDYQQYVEQNIVPTSKAEVILGSGVRTDIFDPETFTVEQRETLRRELDIPLDATVVIMVSRVIRSKGVMEFAATAQLTEKDSGIVFLLVGAPDEGSIDRLTTAELQQLQSAVKWIGVRKDVPFILASSDIFVLPTYLREGIPRVLLEAAAMGLPIVTIDAPGCNEVVESGKSGVLIAEPIPELFAEAIQEIVESPQLRDQYRRAARQRAVENFDLSIVVQQTRDIYDRLLEREVSNLAMRSN